jgi:ureidoacrylate peracid hydrolase
MHDIRSYDGVAGRTMHRFDTIRPARTALLAIDMQNVFTQKDAAASVSHAEAIIPAINALTASLRTAGGLVVFTRHTLTREGARALPDWQFSLPELATLEPLCRPGMPTHDIDGRLNVESADEVIDKYRFSALTHHSSDLKDRLEAADIDTVVVVGVISNCCCESTARDASMLGYRTFFISDATAGLSDEEHNAALLSMRTIFADVRTAADMLALIESETPKRSDAAGATDDIITATRGS